MGQIDLDLGESADSQLSRQDLSNFDEIARIAHKRAGLVFPRDKAAMVLARVGKRVRALGVGDFSEYLAIIRDPTQESERKQLINVLTTNVTSFMREEHHFTTLRDVLLPALLKRAESGKRVRIWSSACSTGQEPYSIAMNLMSIAPKAADFDIRILATDIDSNALNRAKTGVFSEHECSSLPSEYRSKFMAPLQEPHSSPMLQVQDNVRSLVSFKQLNLLDEWPMSGRFDIIFCRNVLIYFDRATQEKLWMRFHRILTDCGYLFIGHSERIDVTRYPQFEPCGTTTYRRLGETTRECEGA